MDDSTVHFVSKRVDKAFQSGRILRYLVGTIVVVASLCAVAMRIVDGEDFPTYGLAFWWAVTTVTTVGYGDVVPVTPAGRVLASGLMILAFGFLSLLTGTIASMMVAQRQSGDSERAYAALERIEQRLVDLERRLPAPGGDPA